MKALVAILSFLFISTGAFAQRAINHPINNSPFGNVVFPAGKPATGQPFVHVPSTGVRGGGNGFNRGGSVIYIPYAYPVVTGGYYGGYGFGYDSGYGYGAGVPQQQQPNVTVVYPAQQQTPVIIMGTPPGQPGDVPRSSIQDYPPQPQAPPGADTSGAQADAPITCWPSRITPSIPRSVIGWMATRCTTWRPATYTTRSRFRWWIAT